MQNPASHLESSSSDPMMELAYNYIRQGIPVFPCRPGDIETFDSNTGELITLPAKAPLTPNGLKGATKTDRIVYEFWTRNPGAMVGIPTGEKSGFFVLDVDMHTDSDGKLIDGFAALAALESTHGALPATFTVRTAGGGEHRYFKHVEGIRNRGGLDKGLDIRGTGGFVIAAGSITSDGRRYEANNESEDWFSSIADAPQWLLDLILPKPTEHIPSSRQHSNDGNSRYVAAAVECELDNLASTTEGSRGEQVNASAFSLGQLVGAGALSRDEAEHGLFDAALTNGVVAKDGEREIRMKIKRGLEAGMRQPRVIPDAHDNDNTPFIDTSRLIANSRKKQGSPEQVAQAEQSENAPVDLWDKYQCPTLPNGLLPEVISDFATIQADLMGCDPAGLAMSALTVCAAAIPDSIVIQPKEHEPHWQESARIWTALVGLPSTLKSPTIAAATRPLKAIDSALYRSYVEAKEKYDELSKDEKKLATAPRHVRTRLEDTTIEAAQEVLKDSPEGVLLLQDELSGWFGAMDKYAGAGRGAAKDRSFYLQSFNGGQYTVNRVGRGASVIPNLSITLLGGIQPEPIRAIANDMQDDGLLQRLFPIVLKPGKLGKDAPAPDVTIRYSALIERLHSLSKPLRGSMLEVPVRFSTGAQRIWQQVTARNHELSEAWEAVNIKLSAHIGKYNGLFARLCLIWHCIESTGNRPASIIEETTARRVHDFLYDFLYRHSVSFYTDIIGLSDRQDAVLSTAGYILAHGLQEITLRNMARGDSTMRKLNPDQAEAVLVQLDALGHGLIRFYPDAD